MPKQRCIRVVNHERHQHYTNRNPPWIKWHLCSLTSYDFSRLPDNSKWHGVGIALLASQTDNHIPADPEWIGTRIAANTPVDLSPLFSAGFIDWCKCLACCKQDASKTLELGEERRGEENTTPTESAAKPPNRQRERVQRILDILPSVKPAQAARVLKLWERDGGDDSCLQAIREAVDRYPTQGHNYILQVTESARRNGGSGQRPKGYDPNAGRHTPGPQGDPLTRVRGIVRARFEEDGITLPSDFDHLDAATLHSMYEEHTGERM